MKGTLWTPEEDDIVRRFYPIEGQEIMVRLPGRSLTAMQQRASYIGVTRRGGINERQQRQSRLSVRPEPCPKCGKQCAHAGALVMHQRSCTGNKGDANRGSVPVVSPKAIGTAPRTAYVNGVAVPARTLPAKDDRHNVDKLEGLPWFKYPTTSEGAVRIANVCGKALEMDDQNRNMTNDERAWWASVRVVMQALAARLRPKLA